MKHLVIWTGPISDSHLPEDCLPPDSRRLTINEGVGGIGSGHFAALGRRYGTLAGLCERKGIDLAEPETVTLASFSAGWGLVERLLQDTDSRERVTALLACDSYYTGASLTPKPGYGAATRAAAAGRMLAVLSSSEFEGAGYPSCQAAVGALLEPLEPLESVPAPAGLPVTDSRGILPAPTETRARGGLLWLKYGTRLEHGHHGSRLARVLMRALVTPYLTRRALPISQPSPDALAGLGLAVGAYLLA